MKDALWFAVVGVDADPQALRRGEESHHGPFARRTALDGLALPEIVDAVRPLPRRFIQAAIELQVIPRDVRARHLGGGGARYQEAGRGNTKKAT